MEHRWVVGVSRVLARSDPWEETVLSWQQQIEAVFGRADRRRSASAVPAAAPQASPGTERRQSSQPDRPRA